MFTELIDYPETDIKIEDLYQKYGTSQNVRNHCFAVAKLAYNFASALKDSGMYIDLALVRDAALLHDICRAKKHHEELGAYVLRAEGLDKISGIVLKHNDPEQNINPPDEAAILYLADKMTRGTEYVSLEERFSASIKKCDSDKAFLRHQKRFETAKALSDIVLPLFFR